LKLSRVLDFFAGFLRKARDGLGHNAFANIFSLIALTVSIYSAISSNRTEERRRIERIHEKHISVHTTMRQGYAYEIETQHVLQQILKTTSNDNCKKTSTKMLEESIVTNKIRDHEWTTLEDLYDRWNAEGGTPSVDIDRNGFSFDDNLDYWFSDIVDGTQASEMQLKKSQLLARECQTDASPTYEPGENTSPHEGNSK